MQKMFLDEVTERSARLIEGARALQTGSVSSQEAGDLLREGHTIKGTGRVMGYDDVGSAGLMLEMIWRWIQQGVITPVPLFGGALEVLSAAIPNSLDNPSELAAAMAAVHEFFEGQELPEELPPPPNVKAASPSMVEPTGPQSRSADRLVTFNEPPATPDIAAAVPGTVDPATDEETAGEPKPEPVMSAHDAFAQMADDEVGSDTVDDAVDVAAETRSQPGIADRPGGEGVPGAPAEGESVDDEGSDAAKSAQEAFAALRRSMMEEDTVAAVAPERGDQIEAGTQSADAAGAEESIGSVIAFPVPENDAGARVEGDSVDHEPADHPQAPAPTDVVVLPSTRVSATRGSSEPEDLGGLIGAVQNWAAEEPISVNTGRLYGLVNHIVALRMDIDSVREDLVELAEVAAADPFFSDRVTHIADGITPIADASESIEGRALALAAAPLRDVTNTIPQLGRYLSRKTGKELRVEIVGDDALVDRQVLDRLGDAIRQLVVNSAVHGIEDVDARIEASKSETGSIRIEAKQTEMNLEVSVIDDGRGIDWRGIREMGVASGRLEPSTEPTADALQFLLFQSGFTTHEEADELAGDGEGLAVVRHAIELLNGSLRVESTPKLETRISMIVPVHQAMQEALLVTAGGITWGIPETGVVDIVEMNLATIAVVDNSTVLERADGVVPFASFADLMGLPSDTAPTSIVVAMSAAGPIALGIEEVVGVRRVAAKELGAVLADAESDVVTGAALLGGDQVVLLVDPTRLAEKQRHVAVDSPGSPSARILIVDDSVGVQQVVSSALATSGFITSVAASVADALSALHDGSIDAVVVDFSMPRADGVALAHMVRQRHGDLPIVMLSGVAEGEDVDRAREAGVDAFFDKADFREGGLAEKLRELIASHRSKEQTA